MGGGGAGATNTMRYTPQVAPFQHVHESKNVLHTDTQVQLSCRFKATPTIRTAGKYQIYKTDSKYVFLCSGKVIRAQTWPYRQDELRIWCR